MQRALPPAATGPADFVLEVGVEELPADDLTKGAEALKQAFEDEILTAHGLQHADLQAFGTPRRLVLHVMQLAAQEADGQAEIKGPPESAAFDKDGMPTQALLGWARKNQIGLPSGDLTRDRLVQERPGGRYVVWHRGQHRLSNHNPVGDPAAGRACQGQVRQVDALE